MELRVRKKIVQKPEQVAEIFRSIQKSENEIDKMKEKFWVVGLNVRKCIVYIELVALGTLNALPGPSQGGVQICHNARSFRHYCCTFTSIWRSGTVRGRHCYHQKAP